jgi:hypothetical protein
MANPTAVYGETETLWAMIDEMRAQRDAALERAELAERRLRRERDLSADLEEQVAEQAEQIDALTRRLHAIK